MYVCVKPTWWNSRWCCTAPTSPPMGSCSDISSSLAVSHSMISCRDSWSFPLLSEKASSRTLPTQQTTARHRARTHGQILDSTEITALKNSPCMESQDIFIRHLVTISVIFEGFAMLFPGEQANIARQHPSICLDACRCWFLTGFLSINTKINK